MGALLGSAASAADVAFTGTVQPACFTRGGEGTVTVKATNTLGHGTDALVLAACGAIAGSAERPTWIVEKTSQKPGDPLKLPTVFTYEFNNQNCIRAQPAAPGGSWPANTTETVTFTYRAPTAAAAARTPADEPETLVVHYTAWSQEAPKDQEVRLPPCGTGPPHLAIDKQSRGVDEQGILSFSMWVKNDGGAPTQGEIVIKDLVPSKLKIRKAFVPLSFPPFQGPATVSGQLVTASESEQLSAGYEFGDPSLEIWVEPQPGASGTVHNSAHVCGGGDPTAPCSNPRESNVVGVTLPNPTGADPDSTFHCSDEEQEPPSGRAGEAEVCEATPASSQIRTGSAATPKYAWILSDVPLIPAAIGPRLVHTFATPGKHQVSLVAFANGKRSTTTRQVNVTAAAPGCAANATTLCLLGGRFRVQADWQAINNSTNGVGAARPITSDTGAFWFFDEANLELIVKLIDGRGLNGKYWVFFGALSDVQYQIKVTDTQTGEVRQYVNRQGNLTSFADTAAFPLATTASAEVEPIFTEAVATPFGGDPTALWAPVSDCVASPSTKKLCLSERFDITVTCSAPGTACTPNPVKLTDDTGYFWFFNSANIELMTKVVDGRGLNGKFWFFYGALSDVQYQIQIKDRTTGATKTYDNPQGSLSSVADTNALPGQ